MKILLIAVILGLAAFWTYEKYPHLFGKSQPVIENTPSVVSESPTDTTPTTTADAPPPAATTSASTTPPAPPPTSDPANSADEPAPTVDTPFYLTQRASQVTDQGVTAIQAGTQVSIVSRNGSKAIITDGKATLMVEESLLGTQPPAAPTEPATDPKTASANAKKATTMTEREKYFASLREQEQKAIENREHNKRIYNQIHIVQSQLDQLNRTMSGMSQQSRARYRRDLEALEKQRSALQAQLR